MEYRRQKQLNKLCNTIRAELTTPLFFFIETKNVFIIFFVRHNSIIFSLEDWYNKVGFVKNGYSISHYGKKLSQKY
jgi:hypothetical protein